MHVTFADWVPGICSLLGILVINLIDKDRIHGEEGFGDPRAVWRAHFFLFVGLALMAGGLAGSVDEDDTPQVTGISAAHAQRLQRQFLARL